MVLPSLAPFDVLIGKPWFTLNSRHIHTDWDTNTLSLRLASGQILSWVATTIPPTPLENSTDYDDTQPANDPPTDMEVQASILSPSRAARLLRKPGLVRSFVVFPHLPIPLPPVSTNITSANTTVTPAADPSHCPNLPNLPPDPAAPTPPPSPSSPLDDVTVGPSAPADFADTVLKQFASVFAPLPQGIPPDRGAPFKIDIVPGSEPPARSPYRLSYPERQEMVRQLRALINLGYVSPTISP